MCFAMLSLRVPGIRLQNPSCVKKTFPNFFQKLHALGATVRDAVTGRTLSGPDLLAE
jgi:3-phosphoshikimate 1-carboxyvinyltransferase